MTLNPLLEYPMRQKNRGPWILFAALLATCAIYSVGLGGGFVFDDYPNIVDNKGIQISDANLSSLLNAALSSPSSEIRRPLASLSFAANYLATGLDPFWMKLTNLVIHLLNGALIYFLAQKLLRLPEVHNGIWSLGRSVGRQSMSTRHLSGDPDLVAAMIATGWLLLPINVTCVLYVVQRMESAANIFVLLGLIGYVAGRSRMLRSQSATQSIFDASFSLCAASLSIPMAVGVLFKETAVMLPVYALAVECTLFQFRLPGTAQPLEPSICGQSSTENAAPAAITLAHKSATKRDARVIGLYVGLLALPLIAGLGWLLPKILSPESWATKDFSLRTRLLSEARIVLMYVRWVVFPTPSSLSFYHDNFAASSGLLAPPTTLLSLIALFILCASIPWISSRAPIVALGIALFLCAHLLTATILPLELIYEHRNYFASFGLLLAVVPILLPTQHPTARTECSLDSSKPEKTPAGTTSLSWSRWILWSGLIALWAAQTMSTAYGWGEPLRLSILLATRAPNSPRAQYELGRTYVVYSQYDASSPFVRPAYSTLEGAARLPKSSILPEQALLFLSARLHQPQKDEWWNSMLIKLRTRPPGIQDESALIALTNCMRQGQCDFSRSRMTSTFDRALDHPNQSARLLATYGEFNWNQLGDRQRAENLMSSAINAAPHEAAYHVSLCRMYAIDRKFAEARQQLEALEQLNIGGRLNHDIEGLRKLIPEA